jgi:hypothetical protein
MLSIQNSSTMRHDPGGLCSAMSVQTACSHSHHWASAEESVCILLLPLLVWCAGVAVSDGADVTTCIAIILELLAAPVRMPEALKSGGACMVPVEAVRTGAFHSKGFLSGSFLGQRGCAHAHAGSQPLR